MGEEQRFNSVSGNGKFNSPNLIPLQLQIMEMTGQNIPVEFCHLNKYGHIDAKPYIGIVLPKTSQLLGIGTQEIKTNACMEPWRKRHAIYLAEQQVLSHVLEKLSTCTTEKETCEFLHITPAEHHTYIDEAREALRGTRREIGSKPWAADAFIAAFTALNELEKIIMKYA